MEIPELKFLLDEKTNLYNRPEFITGDPVSIPRSFSSHEDIEISGFMAATIAWGQRTTIVRNGFRLMEMMGNTPYDFVMNAGPSDLKRVSGFVHRTFNGDDCLFFIESLRNIYLNHGGPEAVFRAGIRQDEPDVYRAICHFRQVFLESPHLDRSAKHLANPAPEAPPSGSICFCGGWCGKMIRVWISDSGTASPLHCFAARSTCTPAIQPGNLVCLKENKTTGKPSLNSPITFGCSTRTTPPGMILPCSGWAFLMLNVRGWGLDVWCHEINS